MGQERVRLLSVPEGPDDDRAGDTPSSSTGVSDPPLSVLYPTVDVMGSRRRVPPERPPPTTRDGGRGGDYRRGLCFHPSHDFSFTNGSLSDAEEDFVVGTPRTNVLEAGHFDTPLSRFCRRRETEGGSGEKWRWYSDL